MVNQFFDASFRGPGSPGSPGVGSTQARLQGLKQGKVNLEQSQFNLNRDRTNERIQSVIKEASFLQNLPNDEARKERLFQRLQDLNKNNIPDDDTREIIDLFEAGKNNEANQLIDGAVQAGIQQGFLQPATTNPKNPIENRNTSLSLEKVPSEKDRLKNEELKLKIENQKAVLNKRKEDASLAVEQKDRKAVSSAFESSGALSNIDDLLKDDSYKALFGSFDSRTPNILSDTIALQAKLEQLVSLIGLESREKLKGSGTITDSEVAQLNKSATILGNPGISEQAARKELLKVSKIFKRSLQKSLKNESAKKQFEQEQSRIKLINTLPEGTIENVDGTFKLPTGEVVEFE